MYLQGKVSFGLYFFGCCVLQVAGLFHHASIGNPINIAIVRLILLEDEEVKRKYCAGNQAGTQGSLESRKVSCPVFMAWMNLHKINAGATARVLARSEGLQSLVHVTNGNSSPLP